MNTYKSDNTRREKQFLYKIFYLPSLLNMNE